MWERVVKTRARDHGPFESPTCHGRRNVFWGCRPRGLRTELAVQVSHTVPVHVPFDDLLRRGLRDGPKALSDAVKRGVFRDFSGQNERSKKKNCRLDLLQGKPGGTFRRLLTLAEDYRAPKVLGIGNGAIERQKVGARPSSPVRFPPAGRRGIRVAEGIQSASLQSWYWVFAVTDPVGSS